jgi:hypothetical protein
VIGLACLVLAGLLVLVFPLISNPDSFKSLILRQVEAGIGRKIEVGEAALEFFPRPHLALTQVVIRDADSSQVFLKARHFDLVLRSTPLLRMKVVVKRMRIEHPQITLRRDRTGQWNFLALGSGPSGVGGMLGNPFGLAMLIQETALTEGVVTVVDEFRPDGIRTIELTDLDVAVTTQPQGPPIDLHLTGSIPVGLDRSSLSLAGTIALASAAGQPSADHRPPLQFQGTLELSRVDLRQMMDVLGPRPIPEEVRGHANVKTRISLVPGVSGYDMVFSDMNATVENLAIAGQASLSGIMSKQPTFALTISATPVSLDELLSRFPANWLPPSLRTVIAERAINGTVEVVTATITGSTVPAPHASVTGQLRIRQGQALLGRNKVRAKDLAGTVLLDPDRLRVADITGQYGPMRITTGKLAIAFLEQGAALDLEVGGDMEAADLVNMLADSIESGPVARSLAQWRNISGRTSVAFRLGGRLDQPDGLTVSRAEIVPQHVSFTTPVFPDPVAELSGRLVYSPRGLEFDQVTGGVGQAHFQLHGTLTTENTARFQGFTAWVRAPASHIVALISPTRLPDPAVVQGPVSLGLSLAGSVAAPQMKGVLELNSAVVSIAGLLHKPTGQPAALEFDASLSPDGALVIPRLEFVMPPVRLSGRAAIQRRPVLRVSSSLISGPIPLSGLPPGMILGGFDSGTLEVSLDVKGKGQDWRTWSFNGWVALTDGRFASKAVEYPLTDIYLRMQLVRAGADIKRLEFRVADSFIRLAGTIRNWRSKPVITATVESPNLDFELLIPKEKRSPVREFLEDLAATSRVSATVGVTRGRYKQFTVREASARIAIGDQMLDVSQITGQIEAGTLADSRLVVRLPRRKPAEGELKLRISGLPAETLLDLVDDHQRLITGDVSLTATLQGNGRHPRGVANTLNGMVEFRIDNGRIEKGTIVPKILMILDIPSRLQGKVDLKKEGLPFDTISGSVMVENGILTTKNLLIDSPVVKISGAGTYVIPADELDLAVVVSPFGSYTKLLQSIPLFGKLIAGERQGFTTAFFDVKGSLKDPQVINRPMKSVGAGLTGLGQLAFDVLRNTLMLPVEILSPDDEKAPTPNSKPAPPPP